MTFEAFFQAIDRAWPGAGRERVPLRVLGSAALILQTDYHRGTNDGDVLETESLTPAIQARLHQIAGKGTDLYKRQGSTSTWSPTGSRFCRAGRAGMHELN
jgi:hypothetical protein